MNERPMRNMIYFDGSAVRKLDYEPVRQPRPDVRPELRPDTRKKQRRSLDKRVDKALAFNLKYTLFVMTSVVVMVAACVAMLYMETKINDQKNNISELQAQLDVIQKDNSAYAVSLEGMYTMDQISDIAVNELGMVYAKKGQIVYYESANEDYVKQYKDVPEAN